MLTPHLFRRFETVLLSILEPAIAGLICEIVAAKMEGPSPESSPGNPGYVIEADGIDVDVFAGQNGQSRQEASASLLDFHQKAQNTLGFGLFDALSIRRLGQEHARGAVVELSKYLKTLLEGTAHRELPRQPKPDLRPDSATRKALDMLTAAAASEAGLRFLWRLASVPDSAGAQLEIGRLTGALKYLAGDKAVLLGKSETSEARTEFPLPLIALSAILHAGREAVLILPFPAHWLKEASTGASDDDNFRGPEEERESPAQEIDPGASIFLRLLRELDCTTIIAIPGRVMLEPEIAALFSGAFGPYRLDRASALAGIKSQSVHKLLGDRQAEKVLEAMIDPIFAGEILRGAKAIAEATEQTVVELRVPSAIAGVAKKQSIDGFATNDHHSMPEGIFETLYNAAVEDLASSIRPHIARPAALLGPRTALFDPDLFCSDPGPQFLFDRANVLRETGARIILAGPSGTGKSALAGYLAQLMKLEIKQYTGASLFARAWGQTEKNIAAAAAAGQGYLTFYDEADSLMGNRFTESESNRHLTVCATNAFLSAYQDAIQGSPVIAATNRIDDLDPAVRRRFDIILTTTALPEEKELTAWRRILRLEPPPEWKPAGDSVPGDFVKAARYLELAGTRDAIIAASSVVRARNERREEGILGTKNPVGFT